MKRMLAAALAIGAATVVGVGSVELSAATTTFSLAPNPKFEACLAEFPGDVTRPPQAVVTVTRGALNDTLQVKLTNIKPKLQFDLFTVQNSSLGPDGTPDPGFTNFGLAWYQSDLKANNLGIGSTTIKTILLDQIFGFDPAVALLPTNTFHVGFWFNDPNDAAPCGFDVTKPTPFNGEHKAGPVAMISLPDATTHLGPLCTNPDFTTSPPTCHP